MSSPSLTTDFVNFHGGEPCLAPVSPPAAPQFDVPAGACDTHAHVFGPLDRYPCIDDRNYTPAADVSDEVHYHAMLRQLHMRRGVLVQPSVYGTDNTRLLDVVSRAPDTLRGVVVVDERISDGELAAMDHIGVRGVRFNLLYQGGSSLAALEAIAARIAPLGWHIDLLIRGETLPDIGTRLGMLPVPIVFDHMAQMPLTAGFDTPAFQALYRLLDNGRTFIKISGANRFSTDGEEFDAVRQWRRRLIDIAPQAGLWGSDWPHVGVPKPIDPGALFNAFGAAFDDPGTRRTVLVDNPAALYGFAD